jgi:DNA-binding NtrC family response regulator
MLRVVAYAPDGVQRFPILRSPLVVGSDPECDVRLDYRGVHPRHARLTWDGAELRIEDVAGDRKGLLVAGRKVREAAFDLLDEVKIGPVTLLVEDALPDERGAPPPGAAEPPAPPRPEVGAETMIRHLARVTEWVMTDVDSRTTSEALVGALLDDFGGGVLVLLHGELEAAGIKLLVASREAWLGAGEELVEQTRAWLAAEGAVAAPGTGGAFGGTLAGAPAWLCAHFFVAVERPYVLVTAFPSYRPRGDWSPVASLRALGDLIILGLVHHVGWYEPILPGHPARQELVLEAGVAVGGSAAIERVLAQLRAAIDPPVHVLLRGEPGSGREALARALHDSGPRRGGPFVAATCAGAAANPFLVEAALFGAEVAGRDAPVRRDGKLLLADGGTLYLDEVDRLPLDLQARLVRFLRSGEVEPANSARVATADVRLIAASRVPLEPLARRDQFRVDLAYRLSQVVIDVPPLRERKEDLPLLIQTYVNRFCHETGKRMAGITVKAMSALLAYDWPGNLPELETIVRQLVDRCPSGRPIELDLLPEKVRLATVRQGARVDAGSDLALDRLVAATEEAAIREALKRTAGNKSQAARLLGLSRNGLAMKMERFGVGG